MTLDASTDTELSLSGFKTRHQIDFLADNWAGIMDLLRWVDRESGHVAYIRSRQGKGGEFEVSLGVEDLRAGELSEAIKSNEALKCVRTEHLLLRNDVA